MTNFNPSESDIQHYTVEIDEAIRKLDHLREKIGEIQEKEVFQDRLDSIQKNLAEMSKKLKQG